MNKILKKYTTIPEHLYVKRAADKQLEEIINDMQRPGYVLVARQMGKTNLLFHAKRTLESKDRLFVYVDLSNSFDHEKDCYRNIIDCILEPNEELFESIEIKIHNIRDMQLQAHKEYSRSLREILNYFQGDLVIVLDEIDALRGAEYSDNIFAQIRSNYFSRTNFPVFERLTYILSGVIEPTELIKDRNKSPFNIGDKIYLDDFTFEEHEAFIQKSELEVDNEISREIYKWTNGNPRLTFDICADIEAQIIDGNLIDNVKISKIIKDKYLVSYDIAPVDHIRELIKSNKKVRDAVSNIHKKNYDELNDEIRNKLYLYGIISSDLKKDPIIKNPIIAKSISGEWIQSVNRETQGNFSYGLSLIEDKKYLDAVSYLVDYLDNSEANNNELEICNYYIGFSLFHLNKIGEAITYFSKPYDESPYKENSRSLLGMCLIKNGDIKSGKDILKEFINLEEMNFASRNAIFNYANIIREEDPEQALTLYNKIVDSSSQIDNDLKGSELNKLYTSIFTFKALIYHGLGDNNQFVSSINTAMGYSDISEKLYLDFLLYTLSDLNEDNSIIEVIANTIIDNELKLKDEDIFPCNFTYAHLLNYLDLTFNNNHLEIYEKLLDYSTEHLVADTSKARITIDIHKNSERNHLDYFLETNKEVDVLPIDLLNIYRYICMKYFNDPIKFYDYFYRYKELFSHTEDILRVDIYFFAKAIKELREDNKDIKALQLCILIEEIFNKNYLEEIESEFILIYFWTASIYKENKSMSSALKYANKTLALIGSFKEDSTSLVNKEGLKSIVDQIDIMKFQILSQKQYGRNDKIKVHYPNQGVTGIIKEGKYKKFADDINNKKCIVIE